MPKKATFHKLFRALAAFALASPVLWTALPARAALDDAAMEAKAKEVARRHVVGLAQEWETGFQPAHSPVMHTLTEFHGLLLYVIAAISALVFALLIYVCVRYRRARNPVPSTTSHNTPLEIIWTALPVLVIVVIAVQSMKTLYFVSDVKNADMTLKVTGSQWYWEYNYPDNGVEFVANMLSDAEVKQLQEKAQKYAKRGTSPKAYRLLETDNVVVLPVDTNVRVQLTAADVIHDWAVPSLGVKLDAVPGRLNETWLRIDEPGYYFGQCSELCGQGHAFMPISIKAVPKKEFNKWIVAQGGTIGAAKAQE
ncbi:MAG: cytochrome c oxidase subunit II [Rickettsiales bacterium]